MNELVLFGFLSIKTLILIIHVLGVIISFGAAIMTDAMFFTSIKKKMLATTDLKFMKLGSSMVWIGLSVILLSGASLLLLDPTTYFSSSKFLAKMTVVLVLFANGVVFHFIHLPVLWRNRDSFLPTSPDFIKRSSLIYLSGAISSSSWITAFVLAMLKSFPFSYGLTMMVYVAILLIATIFAMAARMILLRRKEEEKTALSVEQ